MDIRNFTQFANLLSTKQIVHLHPTFDRLVMCMMNYNSMCACGGDSNKNKSNKATECNRIYREALSVIEQFKSHFFSSCGSNTISFYIENNLLKTICR